MAKQGGKRRLSNGSCTAAKQAFKPKKKLQKKMPLKKIQRVHSEVNYNRLSFSGFPVFLPNNIDLYSAQKLIIVKVLAALKNGVHVERGDKNAQLNGKNALIESPTGTGKTLALLASSCAFLQKYKSDRDASVSKCPKHSPDEEESGIFDVSAHQFNQSSPNELSSYEEEDYEDDCTIDEPSDEKCTCLPRMRIYYGTRTHRQISQVIKEFRRLPYAESGELKHTILASRNHSCINEHIRNTYQKQKDHGHSTSLSSLCKDLNKTTRGCTFKQNLRKYEYSEFGRIALRQHAEKEEKVWDLEDLVTSFKGIGQKPCPYFGITRALNMDADVIFAPFNYLLDPISRQSAGVNLKKSILIMDEAHNIEDFCREVSSFALTDADLENSICHLNEKKKILEQLHHQFTQSPSLQNAKNSLKATQKNLLFTQQFNIKELLAFYQSLKKIMINLEEESKNSGSKDVSIFDGAKLFDELRNAHLILPPRSQEYRKLKQIIHFYNGAHAKETSSTDHFSSNLDQFRPDASSLLTIERFMSFLRFFTDKNKGFYRCIMKKESEERDSNRYSNCKQQCTNSAVSCSHQSFFVKLSFQCMYPGVAFVDAFKNVHSIILSSGTLCPKALKSELGVHFDIEMKGDEVINPDRVFASIVHEGPTGIQLQATYKNMTEEKSQFFQELSKLVVETCLCVPKGVLCFVTSYTVLHQLYVALKKKDSWKQLSQKKALFMEPKNSKELDQVIVDYTAAIKQNSHPKMYQTRDGALLLAVYRGKISEGIDFSDDMARCVICVGIPFPAITDETIRQKKNFNDLNSRTMRIITGAEWYTMQAYRALNQALGRSVRHRMDWGALLLVDARFQMQKPESDTQNIAEWIRKRICTFENYTTFQNELKEFISKMNPTPVIALPLNDASEYAHPKASNVSVPTITLQSDDECNSTLETKRKVVTEKPKLIRVKTHYRTSAHKIVPDKADQRCGDMLRKHMVYNPL